MIIGSTSLLLGLMWTENHLKDLNSKSILFLELVFAIERTRKTKTNCRSNLMSLKCWLEIRLELPSLPNDERGLPLTSKICSDI